ncbi:MAG: type II toxin-antitoxin system YafQ family toxin [Chloroherpetonaceae bacterium]|nr:type II toxin-antitoxin system YafQ family toxin [Chloroherpetonaceae bacterium]
MISICFSSSFQRAYKKRIKGNLLLQKRFEDKLEIFKKNPFEKSFFTHKLSGDLKDLMSFSIDYDVRVVFYFNSQGDAVFVDIGSHDAVY